MVSSRHRSSTASESSAARVSKIPLEDWTTREKVYLAALAKRHHMAWNTVARHMQAFVDKERPDGWSNVKTCAAQYDKLTYELGVDKRPKRNEPSDKNSGNSAAVIYKKMAEKRIEELKETITDLRKQWLEVNSNLDVHNDNDSISADVPADQVKQKTKPSTTGSKTPSKSTTANAATTSTSGESDKPPTRALTRRESSRQNLEKTLSILCKEASEIKAINLFCKPSDEAERDLYDKVVLKHMDISIIKKRLGSEVDDAYAVMNDLLLMFQNATMFYPPDHSTHKAAIELRGRLVPQWEKALLDRFRSRHQ